MILPSQDKLGFVPKFSPNKSAPTHQALHGDWVPPLCQERQPRTQPWLVLSTVLDEVRARRVIPNVARNLKISAKPNI